jgi:hypothetical protein
METRVVQLFEGMDGENAYALKLVGDEGVRWRVSKGYAQDYQPVWTVELQSERVPEPARVDWERVMDWVIEAYSLSDPVIANFRWPLREG